MAKMIWTATCAAIVTIATAALIAQAAPSAQTPSPQQTTASSDRHVIVTGCLTLAPAKAETLKGTAGTSGTADAAAPEGTVGTTEPARAADSAPIESAAALPTFLVTIASLSPADAPISENSGDKHTSAAAPKTYRVVGNAELLSEHVGEQVEVTGTLEEQNASAPASVNGAAGANKNVPTVHLESGKTLAPLCGPGV